MSATLGDDVKALKKMVLHNAVSSLISGHTPCVGLSLIAGVGVKIYQAFLMSATLGDDVKALKKMVLHNAVSPLISGEEGGGGGEDLPGVSDVSHPWRWCEGLQEDVPTWYCKFCHLWVFMLHSDMILMSPSNMFL